MVDEDPCREELKVCYKDKEEEWEEDPFYTRIHMAFCNQVCIQFPFCIHIHVHMVFCKVLCDGDDGDDYGNEIENENDDDDHKNDDDNDDLGREEDVCSIGDNLVHSME